MRQVGARIVVPPVEMTDVPEDRSVVSGNRHISGKEPTTLDNLRLYPVPD